MTVISYFLTWGSMWPPVCLPKGGPLGALYFAVSLDYIFSFEVRHSCHSQLSDIVIEVTIDAVLDPYQVIDSTRRNIVYTCKHSYIHVHSHGAL